MRRFFVLILVLSVSGCGSEVCRKSYHVVYLPDAQIDVDGVLSEPEWESAQVEGGFSFPWEKGDAPVTEFRSFCDDEFFHFCFVVEDADVVVEGRFESEFVVNREDRVEIFFSRDVNLERYFCIEVDALGRVHSYAARSYRHFDSTWEMEGLRTAGLITEEGYTVEGSVALVSLERLGLLARCCEDVVMVGLFRAEFNEGRLLPEERWISWVEPKTRRADFHVPSGFGCFVFYR